MNLDKIIYLLTTYTYPENKKEMGEQDEAPSSTAGAAYPTVTKWETGLLRSVANQIDYKVKWKDLYKITRGKSNTLL
jgi:hypothetical protein